jgi:flagellar FliL protein
MSDSHEPKAEGAAAKKPTSPMLVIGVAAGALVAGGALGMLLVGPQVVAARNPNAAAAAAAKAEGGHGEKKGGHGGGHGEGEKADFYHLENIIVNPAGSQGSRFLMASVAIQLPDSKVEARFKEREVMLRDIVISTLERQTMEQLNRPGARDSVRDELVRRIQPIAGTDEPLQIFMPQFVIQ